MTDLCYLRIEKDRVVGSYGDAFTRSDLTNITCGKDWILSGEKKPSQAGILMVGFGILLVLVTLDFSPIERDRWLIFQWFGKFTVPVMLSSIVAGTYLIMKRRERNKSIPDLVIEIMKDGNRIPVLVTNDVIWGAEVVKMLTSLRDPNSGNWELFSREKRIVRIE